MKCYNIRNYNDLNKNMYDEDRIVIDKIKLGDTMYCIANPDVQVIVDDLEADWSAWTKYPTFKQ